MSSKTKHSQAGEAEIPTVTLERDPSQLSEEDRVELTDACGEVRDSVRDLHNQAIGMARSIERPNHMLKRESIEHHLRQAENHAKRLRTALQRIPYATALLLVAAFALTGCGSHSQGNGQESESVSNTPAAVESGDKPKCNGNCRAGQ